MKIVEPLAREMYDSNPMKHIEAIGRICYKSEDKITETSAAPFIRRLANAKHGAMLEHFIFIVQVPDNIGYPLMAINPQYIECTTRKDGTIIISGSARAFMDILDALDAGYYDDLLDILRVTSEGVQVAVLAVIKHLVWYYGCDELFGSIYSACEQPQFKVLTNDDLIGDKEIMRHGWHSVLFRHDRGFTHELVRMRPASFAQESTRYCNYNDADHVEFIQPFRFSIGLVTNAIWSFAMRATETAYKMLTGEQKESPQWARGVLPQSVKADIVMTTRNWHWQHTLNLRYIGTTGAPHPQMKEGMQLLTESADWAAEMIGAQNL